MNYNNVSNVKFNGINGVNKVGDNDMTFQEQVDEMLGKISERAELEVPEYGDFAPVMEFFPNLDKDTDVSKYGLKIYKMPKDIVKDPKQRYVEAAVYMPAGDYKADKIVAMGHKNEILKAINSPEFPEKLNQAYRELLNIIENQ
ncbi:MAG: hypothetical protein LUB59_07205 [Candidatus Gastranaerophilales bacterium]|nr:hypothetical protein [Candidatus Gastranaerophilales bacterium]